LSFPEAIPSSRAAPPRRHGASGDGRGPVMPTATDSITDRPPTTTTGVPSRGSFRPSIRIDSDVTASTHLPHRWARRCFPRGPANQCRVYRHCVAGRTQGVKFWRDQGKRDEAGELLAPVYGWFTEGFDSLDQKEAKKLLDELQHAPATRLGIASSPS
jgi:hypothetical protein